MVRRGGYRTQAQKDGRSAGQRKRRMARERKRQNREANVYPISVRSSTVSKANRDTDDLAVYGVYEKDGSWILTAMAVRRSVEKMLSDRQGATTSEVRDRIVVLPRRDGLDPKDGLRLKSFDTKSDAMSDIGAESSTRVTTGEYIVSAGQWGRTMNTYKVDRNKYSDFLQDRQVTRVRDN